MRAVIMAGGKGTRLASLTRAIPKPMIPVMGKPILEYQIESLKQSGVTEITLIVGYLGEEIQHFLGDGKKYGVSIDYITETEPLGTAGALYYLKEKITDDFILAYGDLIFDVDFDRFMASHKEHKATITLYSHPNSHPFDSDVIVVDKDGVVTEILQKNGRRDSYYHNLVNAGLYCVSPAVLEDIDKPEKIDFEKTVLACQIERHAVYAYRSSEYVKDMGTLDRLEAVTEDIRRGIVKKRSLKEKQKAIFLDRDGTLNRYVGFLTKTNQFSLLPGVGEAIAKINASAYLAIVATNQPVIARGECSFEQLEEIHMKMETDLGKDGAYLDDLFFCPHHPHSGYKGERRELKINCDCRKPGIGMIQKAAEKYNLDLENSWYVGDTTTDIQTGINAGMRTVLVLTGEAGNDGKYPVTADYTAINLLKAVEHILQTK